MLDISVGFNELKFVSELHIVAVKNDVKELLWVIKPNFKGIPSIKTINIYKDHARRKCDLDFFQSELGFIKIFHPICQARAAELAIEVVHPGVIGAHNSF